MAEAFAPGRLVVHNFSIGAENPHGDQRRDRTAWSAAADDLAWNQGAGRLLVAAIGNADFITDPQDYPHVNLGPPHVQQPAQAWNVLSVGGYTERGELTADDKAAGYPDPLAVPGQLSPHSRTGLGGSRPIKPEIVMEAGNTAPGGGLVNPEAQGLSLLTLGRAWRRGGSLTRRTWATSPAAAAASNALARLARAHPDLRPATLRGLLVHSARWPSSALSQMRTKHDLLRSFGYGSADAERVMSSRTNRPIMVYEGMLQPRYRKAEGGFERRADFVELPFPFEALNELGETSVGLSVTLSYFVEPTESPTRRDYAGARLRWDLQGPTEDESGFRARINKVLREEGVAPGGGSFDWEIGSDARSRGSVQHDRTAVPASALAGSRLLAIQPVLGWWEDSVGTALQSLPYSIVVSVDLGDVDVDLFALVEAGLVEVTAGVEVS